MADWLLSLPLGAYDARHLPGKHNQKDHGHHGAAGLSPEQYKAMQPDRQWSEEKRTAILASLSETPNGKVLADTLDKFQDGGSVARLRTNVTKRLNGEELNPTSTARADSVIGALRHAPTGMAPSTVYRGMSMKGSTESILGKYKAGSELDLNLTSFSADRDVATRFVHMTGGGTGKTRVMVELVGSGTQALPVQNLARDRRLFKEKEWVTGGKYKVVSSKKSPSGGVVVRLEQIGAL